RRRRPVRGRARARLHEPGPLALGRRPAGLARGHPRVHDVRDRPAEGLVDRLDDRRGRDGVRGRQLRAHVRGGHHGLHGRGRAPVAAGQYAAGRALGFTNPDLWRSVVAPQAWRVAIPGYTTYGIGLLKDSSIASTIGVAEMVFAAGNYARTSGEGITVFMVAA